MNIPRIAVAVTFVASLIAGCAAEEPQVPDDLLARDQPFVALPTASLLAIRKDVLDGGWFPATSVERSAGGLSSGTELVWFRPRGDKVFVFVSFEHPGPGVVDPSSLRKAYRIVRHPEIGNLAGSDRYVVVEIN